MVFSVDIGLLYLSLTVVLILVVTYIVGRVASKTVHSAMKRAGIPESEAALLGPAVGYSIYVIGILIALAQIGIDVIYFWIAFMFISVILGISARNLIADIISGYFLRLYGPFDVGDVVKIGENMGLLKDLTLLRTVIEKSDRSVYSIENSQIVHSKIQNFTRYKNSFPVELEFEVQDQVSIDNTRGVALEIVQTYPKTDADSPIRVQIKEFSQKGLRIRLKFYVQDFRVIDGAKDFVASAFLKRSQKGDFPILFLSEEKLFLNSKEVPNESAKTE